MTARQYRRRALYTAAVGLGCLLGAAVLIVAVAVVPGLTEVDLEVGRAAPRSAP